MNGLNFFLECTFAMLYTFLADSLRSYDEKQSAWLQLGLVAPPVFVVCCQLCHSAELALALETLFS